VERHPDAEQVPGILIVRPNGILFFANANRTRNRLRELVGSTGAPLKVVLLNLEASPEIDVTSLEMLEQVNKELRESGIELRFARMTDIVRDLFARSGFLERLGPERIFPGVDVAVDAFLLQTDRLAAQSRSA
jgi:MFS superfamily sulfate permease-like transporter